MQTEQPKKREESSNFNFNLKIIIVLVAVEVLILVCISFVKIYVDKKASLILRMRDEVQTLERIFVDDLDYSSHVLEQMKDLIAQNYNNDKKIDEILSRSIMNVSEKTFFGWRGFYWLDNLHIVRNAPKDSQFSVGTNLSSFAAISETKKNPGKVVFARSPTTSADGSAPLLNLAIGINNQEGMFAGTLFLEIESDAIRSDIETYRRNNYTEFMIVDSDLRIITAYPSDSNQDTVEGKIMSDPIMLQNISEMSISPDNQEEASYISMMSGKNFLAQKIKDKPYILIVSLDSQYVNSLFTKKIALKFLEIAILASFFMIIILMVYRRETWLRARAERASSLATKAMIAKSDFLAYAAHEIRSPLGFILTGSEIMSKKLFGPIPAQYEDYVSGIYQNSRLILDFINDILDEKHVASGNFKMIEDICDIEEIIDKSIKTNKTRFHSRKINISKILDKNLPSILGDQRKILQMLNNLISNSYKYSLDNTTITVIVKKSHKKLKIIVHDEGIGMSSEDIKIAMTKYGTAHNNKSDNFIDSYGLGLPIVSMLSKAHDAHFDLKSEVGIGTEAILTFPEKRLRIKPDNNSQE